MDSAHDATPLLQLGQLYLHVGQRQRLLRLICCCQPDLYFKQVDRRWSSTPKQVEVMTDEKALLLAQEKKLISQSECIRPAFMSLSDEEIEKLRPGAIAIRDHWHSIIEALVQPHTICATYAPETSRSVLALHAEKHGIPLLSLQRAVHRYAWFGLDKNALLPLDPMKGGRRAPPVSQGTKRGTPNSAVLAWNDASLAGVNVTQKHIAVFTRALRLYWISLNNTLEKTYELMREEMFVVKGSRDADGNCPTYRVRQKFIPTLSQFIYHSAAIRRQLDLDRRKLGEADGKELSDKKGRDIDIASEVGEVFDIDATPFNRELVADFTMDGKTVNLSKPTVVLVFDRRSRKVVGWHVYVGQENWKEGYRLAVFSALTSKTADLERLGIEAVNRYPLWPVNIACGTLYADGGPGSSHSAQAALARLNVGFIVAPPATPYWKPTVEGGLGHLQCKQARLSGGYSRGRFARDKEGRRLAKLLADKTLFEFEQRLVLDIITYNAKVDLEHMLTHRMKRRGVMPSPDRIFKWGVDAMGGVEKRRLNSTEVFLALLERQFEAEVTLKGVRLQRAHYNSDALRAYRRSTSGPLVIEVIYHPRRLSEAFWITPTGELNPLQRDDEGEDVHGTMDAQEIELWFLHNNAARIAEEQKGVSKRRAVLSKRQTKLLVGPTQAPKKQRTKPTANIEEVRRIQARTTLATDDRDKTATYLPNFETVQTSTGSEVNHASSKGPRRISTADLWSNEQ